MNVKEAATRFCSFLVKIIHLFAPLNRRFTHFTSFSLDVNPVVINPFQNRFYNDRSIVIIFLPSLKSIGT